jgi:hypothetical protein
MRCCRPIVGLIAAGFVRSHLIPRNESLTLTR